MKDKLGLCLTVSDSLMVECSVEKQFRNSFYLFIFIVIGDCEARNSFYLYIFIVIGDCEAWNCENIPEI